MRECRICYAETSSVFNLGSIYPSTFLTMQEGLEQHPLHLVVCPNCGLVQLEDTVNLDMMFRKYWYRSSLNKTIVDDLSDIVDNIMKRITLKPNDIVVDIGTNDATMMNFYPNNLIKVGFDPALNLREYAIKNCTHFINDYFTAKAYPLQDKAKVVTSIAMFYDLEHPNEFVQDIRKILDDKGIWVIQFVDLINMLEKNEFATIVHEHLETYSLSTIKYLLERQDLEIFDVQYNNTNGGSMRIYVQFPGVRPIEDVVSKSLEYEANYLDSFVDPFVAFSDRVSMIKRKLLRYFDEKQAAGKRVFGLGASTKANTLLQYFGIDDTLLPYIGDINPDKFGLKTVGSNIEIISEKQAFWEDPDSFVILTWHFADGIIERHLDWLDNGGEFVVPMPEPRVYTFENGALKVRYL